MLSRFSLMALILGLVFSVLAPNGYAAKIYHWIDDKGQPHFSENAPRAIKSETINMSASGTGSSGASDTGSSGASDTATKSPLTAKPKAVKGDEKESASAEYSPEDNAKYCQQSRDLLQQMKGNAQRRFEQSDGSFRKLEQTEVADYQSQAREGIKHYCK
ncbi:MAG: hypothetical protein ACI910_000849 [Oleispira sp.]|jgi:hypothetical protein